jgi:hypothetical protein
MSLRSNHLIDKRNLETVKLKEQEMNTANLQLEGLIMAVAAVSEAIVRKGLMTVGFHAELSRFFHREVSHL